MTTTPPAAGKGRRLLKILGFVCVFLVLGVGVLIAFAPAIASGLAPGIVQNTANGMIAGQVKVASTSLSWGGPQKVGPIELLDPSGKLVATVNVETTAGLWGLARGSLDLGTVTVSAKADLIKNADGSTNLEKATAPRQAGAKPAGTGGGTPGQPMLPAGLAAKVVLTALDVTYQETDDAGKVTTTSLKGMHGEATVSSAGNAALDLTGSVSDGSGSAGSLKLNVKASNFADAQGKLTPGATKVDADVNIGNLPVAMVDALGRLHGQLSEALGPTLSTTVKAKGDATAGDAKVTIDSRNVKGNLDVAMRDGRLTTQSPGSLSVVSTAFLAKMPALKDGLAKAGVAITQWPGVDASVVSLVLPMPKAGAGELDLRGIGMDIEVKTKFMAGTMKSPGADGAAQAFQVQPAKVTIKSADLATGVKVTAATAATLDQQAAGAFNVNLEASELLDGQGHLALKGGLPGRVGGSVEAKGVATTLIRPFLGADSPVDVVQDLGSTLDVNATFQTAAAGGSGPPPTDVDFTMTSQNIRASAPLRVADGAMTSRADITASVRNSGSLLRRVMEKAAATGQPAAAKIAGDGSVLVTVSGLRIPLPGTDSKGVATAFDVGQVGATVRTQVKNLDVTPKGAEGAVSVQDITAEVKMQPGAAMKVGVAGAMAHEGKPFSIASDLSVTGLNEALAGGSAGGGMIPGVGKIRVGGTTTLTDVPMSLAKLAPAGAAAGGGQTGGGVGVAAVQPTAAPATPTAPAAPTAPPARGGESGRAPTPVAAAPALSAPSAAGAAPASGGSTNMVSDLVNGLIGDRATIAVTFDAGKGGADGQGVGATATGAGLKASTSAVLSATELRVGATNAEATVRPETVKGVLRAMSGPEGTGALGEITTRGPAKIVIASKPVVIPVTVSAGMPSPDFAKAGTANVDVTIAEPLIVTGIPAGDKKMTGGIRDFQITAAAPLAMLGAGGGGAGDPLRVTVRGKMLLDETRAVGNLSVDATVTRDLGSVDATALISGLDTVAVDGVLGQPELVSGALGTTADISVSMKQDLKAAKGDAGSPMRAKVQITKSSRLNTDPLDVMMDGERIAIMAPAKVTWTLDPAWADKFALAPAPGKTQSFRLVGPTAMAVDLRKLSIARRETRGGLIVTDALKPGVFAVDLSASVQKVQIQPLDAQGAGTPVTLEGVTAEVKTGADQSLAVDVKAASVSGGGTTSREAMTLTAKVRDLATAGGIFNKEGYSADIDMKAPSVPTALVDAVAGMNGRLVDLLGPQVKATLNTTNFSPKEGSSGQLNLDVRAFRPPTVEPSALVTLGAPVKDGVIMTGGPGAPPAGGPVKPTAAAGPGAGAAGTPGSAPLRLELAEFNVGDKDKLVQSLGIIASMSKQRTDAAGKPNPALIQSGNLRIPLDPNRGNLRKLNGDIDISLGTVNYTLRTGFGSLIQSGAVKEYLARDVKQPAMKPFRVTIRDGVATYDNVEIPLKIGVGLGEEVVLIPLSGRVDLVEQTIDGEVDLPLELVSGTVLSVLPIGWSDLRGKMLSTLGDKNADPKKQDEAKKARSIAVPVRIHGPLDNPKFDVNLDLFGTKNKGFSPESALQGITDTIKDIGDLFKKPAKKP